MTKFQKFIKKFFPKYYHLRHCGGDRYIYPTVARVDRDASHKYPVTCTQCGYFRMVPTNSIKRACCKFQDSDGTLVLDNNLTQLLSTR